MMLEEALYRLRNAMDRYDLASAEMGHVSDGGPCWCTPVRQCASCRITAPCFHGQERHELVIHKRGN